ncbi:MAG: iron-containing alcohol dehydrogenase [Holophagaceae bacterium]|nr:iron-containing alcohol dehydrogenase [Holophagaceae bacterium]
MIGYQSVFSFALPTKIVFGAGASKKLFDEMAELGAMRPLIVTDKGIVSAGILDKVMAGLPKGTSHQVFDDVEPNPKDINVASGAEKYRSFGADSIVAIGGGSPMDCAKAIGVLAANGTNSIKAFEGKNAPSKPLPPLICVPTTSGTGSELTFSSVITDTNEQYKMTVKNPFTAPRTALCDPELTLTVPASITASTGMDALTHAIEAFTATCAEPISDAVALYAIELIYQNLVKAFENGTDLESKSNMLMGSMLAGIAFSHSDVASVHCIAEALGGMYDLPHGACNAIFLPFMMEYNLNYCERQYARIARAMYLDYSSEREGAAAAVRAVKQLAADVKLPSFSSLNVDVADYPKIALASAKNLSTESNPRPMSERDYMEVLKMAQL